jgi:hypothetical protein
MISGAVARILLRYAAGALVAWGLLGDDAGFQIANDPDLALLAGMGIAAATEALYAVAKRMGWKL